MSSKLSNQRKKNTVPVYARLLRRKKQRKQFVKLSKENKKRQKQFCSPTKYVKPSFQVQEEQLERMLLLNESNKQQYIKLDNISRRFSLSKSQEKKMESLKCKLNLKTKFSKLRHIVKKKVQNKKQKKFAKKGQTRQL